MTQKYYCQKCQWFGGDGTCLAFPSAIPRDILAGESSHNHIRQGQAGEYVFSKWDGWDAFMKKRRKEPLRGNE